MNPSAENIAVYICEKMQAGLGQGNAVEVAEVKVWETDIQSATYRPPSYSVHQVMSRPSPATSASIA